LTNYACFAGILQPLQKTKTTLDGHGIHIFYNNQPRLIIGLKPNYHS